MNDITKRIAASPCALAILVAFTGCDESSSISDNTNHSAEDGHYHDGDGHEGHGHDEGGHDTHHSDDHGEMRSLGSIEIAGATLAVSISAEVEPSHEVVVELDQTAGPALAAIRFWIGDEAATSVPKVKADTHGDHFHGHTVTPNNLDNASLWIEAETADGKRVRTSMSLQ